MKYYPNLTLSITNLAALRRVAARLGFVIEHGPLHNQGSVQQLNEAIARGDALVALNPCLTAEEARAAAVRLRTIAAGERGQVADLLRGLATALETAQ